MSAPHPVAPRVGLKNETPLHPVGMCSGGTYSSRGCRLGATVGVNYGRFWLLHPAGSGFTRDVLTTIAICP